MEKIFEFSLLSGLFTSLDDIPDHIIILVGVILIILITVGNIWLYRSRIRNPKRTINQDNALDGDDNLLELDEEPVLEIEGLDDLVVRAIEPDWDNTHAYSTVVDKEEKEDNTPRNVKTDVLSKEIDGKDIPAVLNYNIEAGDVLRVVLNTDKNLDLAVALRNFKVNNEAVVLEKIDPTNLGTLAGDLSKGKSYIEVLDSVIYIEYENLANFRDGFRLKTGGHLTFHFNESYDNFEFSVLFETGDHKHFKDVTVKLNPEK